MHTANIILCILFNSHLYLSLQIQDTNYIQGIKNRAKLHVILSCSVWLALKQGQVVQIIWMIVPVEVKPSEHADQCEHMHICVSCLPCCTVTVIMRSCQHWNSFHWVKKQFRERKWGDITRLAGGKKVLAAIKKMITVRVIKLFLFILFDNLSFS